MNVCRDDIQQRPRGFNHDHVALASSFVFHFLARFIKFGKHVLLYFLKTYTFLDRFIELAQGFQVKSYDIFNRLL